MRAFNLLCILMLSAISYQARADYTVGDIEYLPGYYNSVFGIGLYKVKEDDISFYGNLQMTIMGDTYDSLTTYNAPYLLNNSRDPVAGSYGQLMVVDFGITKRFTTMFIGYLGIGMASGTGKVRYYNNLNYSGVGTDAQYYINDPSKKIDGTNTNAGLLIETGLITLNIGYHSITNSFYAGVVFSTYGNDLNHTIPGKSEFERSLCKTRCKNQSDGKDDWCSEHRKEEKLDECYAHSAEWYQRCMSKCSE